MSEKKRSSKEEVENLEGGMRMPSKHYVAMKSAKVKQDRELWLFQDCDNALRLMKQMKKWRHSISATLIGKAFHDVYSAFGFYI